MDPTRHPLVAGMVGIVDDRAVVDCVVVVGWDLECVCLVGRAFSRRDSLGRPGLSLRLYVLIHADLFASYVFMMEMFSGYRKR